VYRGTAARRSFAGLLLDYAAPAVVDGVLRLVFARPDVAAAWRASGSQAALEGALAHLGHHMTIDVRTLTTQEA
jgi:hypothetical protein